MPTRPRSRPIRRSPNAPGRTRRSRSRSSSGGGGRTTGAVKEKTGARSVRPAARGAVPSGHVEPRPELEESKRDKTNTTTSLLRKQAEFDNFRKRMERERDESGAAAVREVLKRFLPSWTTWNGPAGERRFEGPLFKGIELVHQQFLDLLKKEGWCHRRARRPLRPAPARGGPGHGRPRLRVGRCPGGDAEGVVYNDRLLRPALVKVTSGKGADRESSSRSQRQDRDAGEEP